MADSNLLYKNNFFNTNINDDDDLKKSKIVPKTNQYMNRQINNRILKSLYINEKDGDSMLIKNKEKKNKEDNEHLYTEKKIKISIDSKDRNIYPKNILGDKITTLKKNPLSFEKDTNLLTIHHENHGFIEEDKIIIQNVISKYLIS